MTLDDLAARLPEVATYLNSAADQCHVLIVGNKGLEMVPRMEADAALTACAAEMERLESWEGVREFIDRVYPAEMFDGTSGDPGPRLLVMLRRAQAAEAELAELKAKVDVLQVCGNCEHYSSSLYECDVKEPRHPRGGDCDCSDTCYFNSSRWATSKRPREPKNIVIRQGLLRERVIDDDVSGEG